MGRALLGLIKGILVGGGVGYCLLKLGHPDWAVLQYLCCGIIGAIVGLICGKAPWNAETIWTPIMKVLVGFGIGAGMYGLGHNFLPALSLPVPAALQLGSSAPLSSGGILAPLIGMLYGMFVEVDDGGTTPNASNQPRRKALTTGDAKEA